MSVRKICAALGATAVVTSGLAFTVAAPASADPAGIPAATDYVGVGSDTTQFVVTDLINGRTVNGSHVAGYNEGHTGPDMASFDACTVPAGKMYPCTPGSKTDTSTFITLRQGATPVTRPNGSGDGKKALYGGTDNPDVTFARSSSGLNDAEVSAGLKAYPFAVDTLVTVTSPNSNAPASLTPQQILAIYNGSVTNWNQVGGKDGVINALKPQSGSGTLSFFVSQLQKIAGDSTFQPKGKDHELADASGKPCDTASATCTDTLVQEHDPTLVTNDPNAIAPFSLGRANLSGPSSVKVVKGWNAQRALFNVLRSKDAGNSGKKDNADWFAGTPAMDAIFGKTGFLCSEAARPLIEANGFKQLKSFADGGSCGTQVGTTSAPDLAVYDAEGVKPVVSVTPSGDNVFGVEHTFDVAVSGAGGTPTGDVTVNLGSWSGQAALTNGAGTVTAPADLPAGAYDLAVTYSGDDNFTTAATDAPLSIAKAKSTASETYASKVKRTVKKLAGSVKVAITPASSIAATGPVKVLMGKTVLAKGTAKNGVAKLALPVSMLKTGKNKLTLSYAGNSNIAGSSKKFTITKK